jgi:hypothetical protein
MPPIALSAAFLLATVRSSNVVTLFLSTGLLSFDAGLRDGGGRADTVAVLSRWPLVPAVFVVAFRGTAGDVPPSVAAMGRVRLQCRRGCV